MSLGAAVDGGAGPLLSPRTGYAGLRWRQTCYESVWGGIKVQAWIATNSHECECERIHACARIQLRSPDLKPHWVFLVT